MNRTEYKKTHKRKRRGLSASSYLGIFLTVIGAMFITFYFFVTPSKVSGTSMDTTLKNNQLILFKKNFKDSELERGKIVVFDAPDVEGERYIKRIIGKPGDKITYKNDKLYVNGKYVIEDYLTNNREALSKTKKDEHLYMNDMTITVPKNCYYVMGDNRIFSKDSRTFGAISKDLIYGIELEVSIPILNEREDI